MLERGSARCVVAAQADAEQPDPAGVDIRPGLQVVHDRRRGHLVVRPRGNIAQPQRFAGSGGVDDQAADAPAAELVTDDAVEELFGHIEPVIEDHDRCGTVGAGRDEVAGQDVVGRLHLDSLDGPGHQLHAPGEGFQCRGVAVRLGRAGRGLPLSGQVVDGRAEVTRAGRVHVTIPAFLRGMPGLLFTHGIPRLGPGVGVGLRPGVTQRREPAVHLVQLSARRQRQRERRGPHVVIGKVVEHRSSLGSSAAAGQRPSRFAMRRPAARRRRYV